MISLETLFWLMIVLFGVIGSLRGWTKEVIATSGLVLSLFFINFAAFDIINFVSGSSPEAMLVDGSIAKRHFYALAVLHVIIAFFSYQGPAFAGARVRDRLRIRDSVQDKILGSIIGGLNGYLLIGALWAFLEYQSTGRSEWKQLDAGVQYVFQDTTITRPIIESSATAIMNNLPIDLLSPYLPVLVVVVFLFVIVVMI
ncbi:MAG: CvpA family protein [Chloroflexota bacterium]